MRPETPHHPSPRPPMSPPQDPRAALFKDHNFRWMTVGAFLSMLGDQFTLIALPWLVLQMTGDTLSWAPCWPSSAFPVRCSSW